MQLIVASLRHIRNMTPILSSLRWGNVNRLGRNHASVHFCYCLIRLLDRAETYKAEAFRLTLTSANVTSLELVLRIQVNIPCHLS